MTEVTISIEDGQSPSPDKKLKIVHISGQLDESNVDEKIKEIYKILEEVPSNLNLIFDLENLEYMNSKSIGYLTDLYGKVNETGGAIAIAKAKANIIDILQVVGLTQLIQNYETIELATASIGNASNANTESASTDEAPVATEAPAPEAEAPAPEPTPESTPEPAVTEPEPAPAEPVTEPEPAPAEPVAEPEAPVAPVEPVVAPAEPVVEPEAPVAPPVEEQPAQPEVPTPQPEAQPTEPAPVEPTPPTAN